MTNAERQMSIFEGHWNLDKRAESVKTFWIPAGVGVTEPQHLLRSSHFNIRPSTILAEPCRRRGGLRTAEPFRDSGWQG